MTGKMTLIRETDIGGDPSNRSTAHQKKLSGSFNTAMNDVLVGR